MESEYPVAWTRSDGRPVAIESMSDEDLAAAHQVLQCEDMEDPNALVLLETLETEIVRRATGRGRRRPALAYAGPHPGEDCQAA